MEKKRSEILLLKYISKKITQNEKQELLHLLNDPKEQEILERMIQNDFILDNLFKEFDKNQTISNVESFIRRHKKTKRLKTSLYIAALFVVGLSIGIVFSLNQNTNNTAVLDINDMAITLTSSNGQKMQINSTQSGTIYDNNGNAVAQIQDDVMQLEDQENQTQYNHLNVPYGKKFTLVLPDGTKAVLNAGSNLKFPSSFKHLQSREVVVDGQIYFEVEKDLKKPFYVISKQAKVKVLGTKFLYTAYKDEPNTSVVLTHGKVHFSSLSLPSNFVELTPGDKASLNIDNQEITMQKVDLRPYLSWIKGELIFRNQSFDQIIKSLERNYNVQIVNNNKKLGSTVFNASFNNNTIEEVLDYFNEILKINYTIKDNKIIIN
ncbi:DUF4974 domain-containing protein [Myroides marinus]|uniref:FecR family protein n=1 Tax=Myroides marinus TaxID=703342 RepID=UPI0025766027|nr:FecR domain-containing protein [Myroides marinus]MDM1384379.1 DUF4974 domain-containing protein [Myroides marinus]